MDTIVTTDRDTNNAPRITVAVIVDRDTDESRIEQAAITAAKNCANGNRITCIGSSVAPGRAIQVHTYVYTAHTPR